MRYAVARYSQKQRDNAYRYYVSDCLRMIAENTAKMSQGVYIERSLREILDGGAGAERRIDPTESRDRILKKFRETEVESN